MWRGTAGSRRMIRLSANLGFLWPDRPLLDRIDAAAAAGFGAIELHWPYAVPAPDVRARCDAHGLALLGVNTVPGDLARGDFGLGALPGRQAEFQAAVDQAIAYCAEANGRFVHCMAGKVPADGKAAARAVFIDNLREAAAKAEPHGLTLLLEPMNPRDAPDYLIGTTSEGTALVSAVARANVRLMFDCYHVAMSEGDVLGELAAALPLVSHVQIASVPDRVEPDEGRLAYAPVFAALERWGYEGWVGAEYRPRWDTDAGLGWMKAVALSPGRR